MAIFNNSNDGVKPAGTASSSTTIITEGSFIKGEMTLGCDLYVDGKFEGNINSEKSITVGKNGSIKGEVNTPHLIVQGVVDGDVDAERIEIKEAGRINGSLVSSELVIEAKGVFEGESRIKEKEQKKQRILTIPEEVKAAV